MRPFTSLWALTLLGAANYFKNLQVAEKLDTGVFFK